MSTLINTSHPGLANALRQHRLWAQVSGSLYGSNKARSAEKISRTAGEIKAGYGGHFRGVQGFRYIEGLRRPEVGLCGVSKSDSNTRSNRKASKEVVK
jgi:hypothetical protein